MRLTRVFKKASLARCSVRRSSLTKRSLLCNSSGIGSATLLRRNFSSGSAGYYESGGVRYEKGPCDPAKRNWDPRKIYPNKPGVVRVTGITLRDGHQSLNGGKHRTELLVKAAELIDEIRPAGMEYPGQEEIGGGTTVDFPLRFKGENPFRNMEIISSRLPNTPTSALIRSDSLCGYNINPRDVVRSFISRYAQCGIDIFRNFDAYNNVANHATVAEAVIDAGKHYQAAITFTSHSDPTLFNVKWVAKLAREFEKLGAHSICIKDMAGIASPALMKAWVTELKQAVPDLPVIIHSHYTTGFAPLTYLQAIEAGASAVDCGISTLSGRSGHPAMEVFNQTLSELGYDLGWDPKEAQKKMEKVAEFYREAHNDYEFCEMKMAGAVDYRVFTQGIPGGQISIMRNELVAKGFGHLFDPVMEQIQRVRSQVGGVALVTPTSEHVARQSIVNSMDGIFTQTTAESKLWPGYSEMLRGTMGRPPQAMDPELQLRALKEWTLGVIKGLDSLDEDGKNAANDAVPGLVEYLWNTYALPIQASQEAETLAERALQLKELDMSRFERDIASLNEKVKSLTAKAPSNLQELEAEYQSILARSPSDGTYKSLLQKSGMEKLVNSGALSKEDFLAVVVAASFCTVCPSSILPEIGMESSMAALEELALELDIEYLPQRGTVEFEEWAILHCMFKHAGKIARDWFVHHRKHTSFWDAHYPAGFPFVYDVEPDFVGALAASASVVAPPAQKLYPFKSALTMEARSDVPQELDFPNKELNALVGPEVAALKRAQEILTQVQGWDTPNEARVELKKRDIERTENRIADLQKVINSKIKSSLYALKSHDVGYQIDISGSVVKLSQKASK